METDTHANTKHVRLPIRTHVRMLVIAAKAGRTGATLIDDMVDEWMDHDMDPAAAAHLVDVTRDLPAPRRGLPPTDGLDPLDEENPPESRQARLPIRTYERVRRLAHEHGVTYSTMIEKMMETYMRRHEITREIEHLTKHLPAPPGTVPRRTPGERGEVTDEALSGEIEAEPVGEMA